MTDEQLKERQGLIDGLRAFADFLEQTPDAPTPYGSGQYDAFAYTKEQLNEFRVAVGGKLDKKATGDYFFLQKTFGPINYDINIARERICEKIVTGKRIVPAVPEREEDVVEWKCGEVLP